MANIGNCSVLKLLLAQYDVEACANPSLPRTRGFLSVSRNGVVVLAAEDGPRSDQPFSRWLSASHLIGLEKASIVVW